ncbi:GNAT family N-acetyltransferase [Rhizobium sp. BK251]|uniref:GNAT family N-acetyltransferase n=1 Tax=Rhizobium sp. BK251 TaxID=2512125 RepID=UPI0010D3A83A|nr:GNAT family N-acetyltransferase [Rhizobium sp. BK251]TCL70439.1 hypothetical protein EV286_107313 [Rhizobium sp. BK251]
MISNDFDARPLTPDRWSDFETLFGPQGGCEYCWCTYFRMSAPERRALDREARKGAMRARVARGTVPPGLLGYMGEEPFAWVQVGPRGELPRWNSPRTASRPLEAGDAEDPGIWAVSCFFMASRFRGKGHSHGMLSAAIDFARRNGARLLEGCPIERTKQSKSVGLYVGPLRIFKAAGFAEVARRRDGRPLMRMVL